MDRIDIPVLGFIDRWAEQFSKWLMVIAAMWAFLLAFYILVDVVGRAFGAPLKGTHEVVKNSIVMIAYMQVAYCVLSRSMLRADFLIRMLRGTPQRIINFVGYVFGALFFFVLFWASRDPLVHAITTGAFEGEGALRVPTWPARLVILVTSALLVVNYVLLALKEVLLHVSEDPGAATARE